MPHLRWPPVLPAALWPQDSTAWSSRPSPRYSERLPSIRRSLRFGVGCLAQFGTADETTTRRARRRARTRTWPLAGHVVFALGTAPFAPAETRTVTFILLSKSSF